MANLVGKNAGCQMSTEGPVVGRRVETKLAISFSFAGRKNSGSVGDDQTCCFAQPQGRQAREEVEYRFAEVVGHFIGPGDSDLGVGT
jgi:hypothetical protein